MNPLEYFSELEDDPVRSDQFEGTDQIHQPKHIKHVTIKDNVNGRIITIRPEDMAGPVSVGFGKPLCNLFCMYSVTEPKSGPFVDERNFAFGNSFIIILNTQQFIDRVNSAAEHAGLSCGCSFVEYYDEEGYSGDTGVYRKPSRFSYQNEFRFVVSPGSERPVILKVGSLVDITSKVLPLTEINTLVDFSVESARKAGLV